MTTEQKEAAQTLGERVVAMIHAEGRRLGDKDVLLNALVFALANICYEVDADGDQVADAFFERLDKLRQAEGQ